LQEGEAFGEETDLSLKAGAEFEQWEGSFTDKDGDGGLDGKGEGDVGEEGGPVDEAEDAGDEECDVDGGGEGERVAEDGLEDGWRLGEPGIEEAGGELLEAGLAEEGDLFAEGGLREELSDGLLAEEGFLVGGGGEEEACEAALADAGADVGEQREEAAVAGDVEVETVEMGEAVRGEGVFAGARGVGFGAVGAEQGLIVEDEQPAGALELGLQTQDERDEDDDCGEGGKHGPRRMIAVDGVGSLHDDDEGDDGESGDEAVLASLEGVVVRLMGGAEMAVVGEDFFRVGRGGARGGLQWGFRAGFWHGLELLLDAMVDCFLCRVLRDVIPPTPPGPEGSNGNGLVWAQ
jgi:hypothetical protein